MPGGRRRALVLLAVSAAVVGAAGCGGSSGGGGSGTGGAPNRTDTAPSNGVQGQTIPKDLQIPPGVPLRATGPASPSSTRTIRRWLAALDRGDIRAAAHYFALPSKFQNAGTPVLHIDNEDERIAINLSLTCGAKAEKTGGAGAYTIVVFRLVERKGQGGGCGPGIGAQARGAIMVVGGRIREWYRLPDDANQPANQVPSGPSA